MVKNPPANAGEVRDTGSNPASGRSPGGGHGNPLQYSCLGNPMDRGAKRATFHGVTRNQTLLKQLIMYTCKLRVQPLIKPLANKWLRKMIVWLLQGKR